MEFLITESQLKIILEEQGKSKFTDNMKILQSFTNNLVNRINKVYGINVKMLLTWGTSVGGMVMPLDNFIKNNVFTLTDDQRMLILAGVVFILFFEGKRGLSKILEAIKKENIEKEFEIVLEKGTQLKEAFQGFLESFRATSAVFMETVAYSFLIPIITDILEVAHGTMSLREASIFIAERLLASGVVVLSREALISLLRKILKKFQ